MKKLLLSLAAAAMTLSASAESFTFEIKNATDIQGTLVEQVDKPDGSVQAYKHYQPLESLKLGAFSFAFAKADEKNTDPAFYYSKTDECTIRLYAGAKMTISGTDVDLKTITFNLTKLAGIDATNLPTSDNGSFSLGTDGKTLTWHAAETDVIKSTVVINIPTEKGADNKNPNVQFASIVLSTEVSTPDDPNPPVGDHVYAGLLASSATCDWTFSNVTLPEELEYIWSWKSYNNAYYLNASAYKDKTAYAAEAYAVSPVVDLTNLKSATATWEQACRFQTTIKDLCKFCVREEGAADWTELTIPEWPELNDKWTWASAGTVDLNAYAGKKVEFAFKYASSADGADTWEIRNFFVDGEEKDGAVEGIEADLNTPARYFDLTGRSVAPADLKGGIFIEVRGSKARKVVIR